jgi:hypothetical protein
MWGFTKRKNILLAIGVLMLAGVLVWFFAFRGTPVATDWAGADLESVVAPYGDHIYITDEGGLSGSTEGGISIGGRYDYHIEAGPPGVTQVTGRIILEDADAGSSILIVAYSGRYGDPTLPYNLRQTFDVDHIYGYDGTMTYIDYVQVSSGQIWLLQDSSGLPFGDLYIFAPGYVNVKFENPPSIDPGERIVFPDIMLPKESIEWNVAPPQSIDCFIMCALYPRVAY